jgi:hypothetical protein
VSADLLRRASTRLRCDHTYPVQSPLGSLWKPGPCSKCGTPYGGAQPVSEALREPLAALLNEVADQFDGPKCDDPSGVCNGCERRFDFVLAIDLAQTILGETS